MARTKHLHEKLGITFQELGALLGARNMLATGQVTEAHYAVPYSNEHGFNMNVKCRVHGCGTVTCIGGMMALIMGKGPSAYVNNDGDSGDAVCSVALSSLFYPPHGASNDWAWITPNIAVLAIDNFLNTGRPGWEKLEEQYD